MKRTNSKEESSEPIPTTPSATPRKKRRRVIQTNASQQSIPTQTVQLFFDHLLDIEQCQYPHVQQFTTCFDTLKVESVVEYLELHCQHFSSDEYKQCIIKEQDLIEKYSQRLISTLATEKTEESKRSAYQLYNITLLRTIQIQVLLRFLFWNKLQHQIGNKNNKKIRDPLNKQWIQSLCSILEIPMNLMDLDASSETDSVEQVSRSKFFEFVGCLDAQVVCNQLHTMERCLNDLFLGDWDTKLNKPFANFGVSIAFIYKHFKLDLPTCLKDKLDEFLTQLKATQTKNETISKPIPPSTPSKTPRKKKPQNVVIVPNKPNEQTNSQEPSTPVQAFKSKQVSVQVEEALQRLMDTNQTNELKTKNLTVNQTKVIQPAFFKVWKFSTFTPSKRKTESQETPTTTLSMDSEQILFSSPSKQEVYMKPEMLNFDRPIVEKPVEKSTITTSAVRKKGFIKL